MNGTVRKAVIGTRFSGGIVMLSAQMWWDEYLLVAMWNFTMAKFIE
jgi:hypothetical protein